MMQDCKIGWAWNIFANASILISRQVGMDIYFVDVTLWNNRYARRVAVEIPGANVEQKKT